MRLPFLLLLTLLTLAPGNARAQLSEVAPGERVWATLSAPEREVAGTVTAVDRNTLTVQIHPAITPLSVPLRSVAVLRESRGFPSRLASAVDTGGRLALTSAFTSGVTELIAGERSSFSVGEAVVFGAITGAVLGGVSGAFCPLERWSRVDLPGATRDLREAGRRAWRGRLPGPGGRAPSAVVRRVR